MKKIIASLFLLAAVLGIGGPYVVGMLAEGELKKYYDNLNKYYEHQITVELKTYERGWFQSKAVSTVTTRNVFNNESSALTIEHSIHHGPVIFNNGNLDFALAAASSDIKIDENIADGLMKVFGKNKIVNIHYKLSYDFNHIITAEIDPIENKFEDDGLIYNINFEKFYSQLIFDYKIKDYQFKIDWPGMSIWGNDYNGQPNKINFKNINGQGTATRLGKYVWVGNAEMSLGGSHFVIAEADVDIQFDDFKIQLDYSKNKIEPSELIDGVITSSLNNININKTTYGPGQLVLDMKNIHAESFPKIILGAQTIFLLQELQMLNDQPDQATMEYIQNIMREFNNALSVFLTAKPQIAIPKLSLETEHGQLQGDLQVKVNQFTDSMKNNPEEFLSNVDIAVNYQIPKLLLPIPDSDFKMIIDKGIVQDDGRFYKLNMNLQNGEVTVNNQNKGSFLEFVAKFL